MFLIRHCFVWFPWFAGSKGIWERERVVSIFFGKAYGAACECSGL
jgi:hypothetical protein